MAIGCPGTVVTGRWRGSLSALKLAADVSSPRFWIRLTLTLWIGI